VVIEDFHKEYNSKNMNSTLISCILLLSTTYLYGQTHPNRQAFIIQGQITDCPEQYLRIFFRDTNQQVLIDTIRLDEYGKFYLKTYKLTGPQRTSIQKNTIQINDIFVAPGYNLTITGNGKDFLSLLKTKKIDGIGSESNKYRFMLDSIFLARNDKTDWFILKQNELLTYLENQQKLVDSVYHKVFDKRAVNDKYQGYFASMVRFDNEFRKLYMLVSHVNYNNYSYDSSIAFVRANFNNKILDDLYKEDYLISNEYRNGFIANQWLNYLINLDFKKDSSLGDKFEYKLKKISSVYKGKVRDFALYTRMESEIVNSKVLSELNINKGKIEPYLSSLRSNFYKESIERKVFEKENELIRLVKGKPAPQFTLESNLGKTYSLDDFKGKVIYLDLWASWCAPCREETPSLKRLYNKYKANNQIVFLSISVNDGVNEWKKAIEKDEPDWIQLKDKDGLVWRSYVATFIPKFIVIDKSGNIVDFDAPRPSSGQAIEKLLDQEIGK
jgi:thiol-disulfide isomerase/thioredoxin